jgi:hypothetical protein
MFFGLCYDTGAWLHLPFSPAGKVRKAIIQFIVTGPASIQHFVNAHINLTIGVCKHPTPFYYRTSRQLFYNQGYTFLVALYSNIRFKS